MSKRGSPHERLGFLGVSPARMGRDGHVVRAQRVLGKASFWGKETKLPVLTKEAEESCCPGTPRTARADFQGLI